MPSVVATLKIKEDKIEEAKKFLKELAEGVRRDEPGTLAYVVHQHKKDPTRFVMYEKYENDEAFATHGKNLASQGPAFAAVLDGRPEIVVLDEL